MPFAFAARRPVHVRRMLVLFALGALAACATPEARVRSALVKAGLSQAISTCMAARMAQQLSPVQLRQLDMLASVGDLELRDTSMNQVLRKVRALRDPEILKVTTSAALICAVEA